MKKIPSMAREIIALAPTMSLTNTSAFVGLSFSPSDLVFVAVVGSSRLSLHRMSLPPRLLLTQRLGVEER
jgi:hypothetical protein